MHSATHSIAVCHSLALAISGTRTVDEVYQTALDALTRGLGVSRASILLFDAGGVMRFTARSKGPKGEPILQKLAFFNLEPGKVRQFAETSNDDGKSWTVAYDLIYLKRK